MLCESAGSNNLRTMSQDLVCRMFITLRNGKKYRRPDGRPICWVPKGDAEVATKETVATSEEATTVSD